MCLTISVSVTDLEMYRRYLADEDMTLASLLSYFAREDAPSLAMVAGSALHKALEMAAEGETDELVADGFRFTVAGDFEIPMAPCREVSISADYEVGSLVVHVRGRVDEMNGAEIVDHKTTSRIDLERLMASYQWRFYLDMTEASSFRWNVIEMKRLPKESDSDPEHYEITDVEVLRQHAYPEMREDIMRLLQSFAVFATNHLRHRIEECAA